MRLVDAEHGLLIYDECERPDDRRVLRALRSFGPYRRPACER